MFFSVIPIKASTWGIEETMNIVTGWKGVVQLLLDQKADLGISSITDSLQRRKAVKYLFHTSTVQLAIFFKSPGPNKMGSLWQPFTLDVWSAILLWILFVFLLLVLLFKRKQRQYTVMEYNNADVFQQLFCIISL